MGRRALTLLLLLALLGGIFLATNRIPRRSVTPATERVAKGETGLVLDPASRTAMDPGNQPRRPAAAPALFEFTQPPNAAELDAALPAPAERTRYVRVNTAWIESKQSPFWRAPWKGSLVLPLPDGGTVRIVIEESEMLGADRFTSRGRIEGRPLSLAVFAFNRGYLHAAIDDPDLGSFTLRAATAEFSQYYRIDAARVPGCGGERIPVIDEAIRQRAAERRARLATAVPAGSPPPIAAVENPQHAEVHVMMAYTQAVLPTMSGAARTDALQSAFDVAIAKVNSVFASSSITARVKLVKTFQVNYARDGAAGAFPSPGLQDQALDDIYKMGDGIMDEIHAARDQAGADMVCLALNRADAASSGLSFLLDDPGALENPLFAFSVVQYSSVTGTNVVPHELGHVFGCAHDVPNAASGPGAYSYSYGFRFRAANGSWYHDIMSYPSDPASRGLGVPSAQELNYFSNSSITAPSPAPANTPGGYGPGKTGEIAPGYIGESNTALTIERNAFEVSTYRLQTQAVPNPGALINVATLAYSGTDNQVLIGGLVIGGTQPKRILLRGAGPALAAFGVNGVLADPILRLFSGPTEIATNNNWETQTTGTAADIEAAASVAGAFAFARGSADAALIATVPPGPYTVFVQGAGGSTGFALVEAYDLDRTANKIVNLSTRGYADNVGRAMTGGFVVQGSPGTTKRILIRVLGPSLEPMGLSGAMEDPFVELRNATGELLVQDDDWSIGSAVAGGQQDDFQPVVSTYGEQQISATGFAPRNRREPCILADLPPGSYTAIVKPFELISSNPDENQEAKPGLVVLEVYEIN